LNYSVHLSHFTGFSDQLEGNVKDLETAISAKSAAEGQAVEDFSGLKTKVEQYSKTLEDLERDYQVESETREQI
jgi:hypothetical protein